VALDRQAIVDAAVALLDEDGLEGVTTRRLAARLGVQSPTLYWHVPNKAALITLIADAILTEPLASLTGPEPDEKWPGWLARVALVLRRALLAHRDGARVVSSAQLSTAMSALSERAMSTLVAEGIPLRRARVIVFALERFTLGHVLEEQAPRPDDVALESFDLEVFTAEHPTLVAGIAEYFRGDRTVDDLFQECLDVVVAGAAATAGPAAPRTVDG
jgi:TetR/AcrR family tetracycline transcriptional repressor